MLAHVSAIAVAFAAPIVQLQPDASAQAEEPGPAPTDQAIDRDRYERLTVPVMIDGQGPYRFLIDTGATSIALSHRDALSIGFTEGELNYSLIINTANGQARAAPVRLDSVAIGTVERRGLRATVAEPGRLDQSLLGMNFISSLTAFEMRRDEVILRD